MKLYPFLFAACCVAMPARAQPGFQDPDKATKLNNQAVELLEQNRYQEALGLFEEALKLDPRDETLSLHYVDVLERLGRRKEALANAQKYLSNDPYSKDLREKQQWLLETMGLSAAARFERIRSIGIGEASLFNPLIAQVSELKLPQSALKPRQGETRIEGLFHASGNGFIEFDSIGFVLSNGRFRAFSDPKRKKVWLKGTEPEYSDLGAVPTQQLKRGDYIIAIGRESKGQFALRRLVVLERTREEEKQRGTLFNMAQLPVIEDQDYPKLENKQIGTATFLLKDGKSLVAQAAAVVSHGGETALVTTITSFGRDEPVRIDSPEFLPQKIIQQLGTTQEVRGLETHGDQPLLPANRPLHVSISKPFHRAEIITVPLLSNAAALSLAQQNPKRGEVVFFAEWYDNSVSWREGVVAYADANRLFMHIGSGGESARVPGSVIVNKKGEVVGLHVAGEEPYIKGVSAQSVRRALQKTAPKK